MKVYCVMSGESRTDLDHVICANTNKEEAENYARQLNILNFRGEPYIETLDVISETNAEVEHRQLPEQLKELKMLKAKMKCIENILYDVDGGMSLYETVQTLIEIVESGEK